jgi:hypothetical protein
MTNKGLDQTFQSFYYTHMMFAGQFNDTTWLNDTLFSFAPLNTTFVPSQRDLITN